MSLRFSDFEIFEFLGFADFWIVGFWGSGFTGFEDFETFRFWFFLILRFLDFGILGILGCCFFGDYPRIPPSQKWVYLLLSLLRRPPGRPRDEESVSSPPSALSRGLSGDSRRIQEAPVT